MTDLRHEFALPAADELARYKLFSKKISGVNEGFLTRCSDLKKKQRADMTQRTV
jgi:hypothetical protein